MGIQVGSEKTAALACVGRVQATIFLNMNTIETASNWCSPSLKSSLLRVSFGSHSDFQSCGGSRWRCAMSKSCQRHTVGQARNLDPPINTNKNKKGPKNSQKLAQTSFLPIFRGANLNNPPKSRNTTKINVFMRTFWKGSRELFPASRVRNPTEIVQKKLN